MKIALGSILLLAMPAPAQQAQNPSPMVEHTRAHPRLDKQTPAGRREKLDLGTLFIPQKVKSKSHPTLLFFFHGGDWLPELAAARQTNMAVVTVQAGAGSGTYAKLFSEPNRFLKLVAEAESKGGVKFASIALGGWSAGCGAIREILKSPASYERINSVLCVDGIHTGYVNGKPGPKESAIDTENLENWTKLGRDAIAGKKRMVVTHSEIFPGTFASTTETADYLIEKWGLKPRSTAKWGPMKTQILSEVRQGKLLLVGFAGNSAPDHVDELHSLPEYLKWLMTGHGA
jgi:hypothetical protein